MGSLLYYCKYVNQGVNNNGEIVEFNGNPATDLFSFKAKITGQTGNNWAKSSEIIVPLKYLRVIFGELFWRNDFD